MRCPSNIHVQVLFQNVQLNSFFGQMSGFSLRININAFSKVVKKASVIAVLSFLFSAFLVVYQVKAPHQDNLQGTT